jgi:hypothetical protein
MSVDCCSISIGQTDCGILKEAFMNYSDMGNEHQQAPPPPHAPPPPPSTGAPAQPVPNYLLPSILVTLCCCLPLGIPAIVFAAQVNGKVQQGDYAGAMESSRKAKMWTFIALGAGIVAGIIYAVAFAGMGVMSSGM